MILNEQQIAEMEGRAQAATEGPWAWYSYGEKCYAYAVVTAADDDDKLVGGYIDQGQFCSEENPSGVVVVDGVCSSEDQSGGVDMPFIAHARQDIPALISSHREQAAEIERLQRDCVTLARLANVIPDQWIRGTWDTAKELRDRYLREAGQ